MRHAFIVLLVLSLAAGISGCATSPGSGSGDGARIEYNKEVLDQFMAATILPGHRYYTTGVPNNPDAILGLKKDYTLQTDRWKERNLDSQQLRQLVGMMNDTYGVVQVGVAGCDVFNDKNEKIGVWYAATVRSNVEMVGDMAVTVNPPNPIELENKRVKGGRGD